MYDPPDTGHEWVEIFNTGEQDVSIDALHLYVNNVRHRLKSTGTGFLSPQKAAIVTRSEEVFFSDYPSYVGTIFLAPSLSLEQNGTVRVDSNEVLGRIVRYESNTHADSTGASLHVTGNGMVAAPPTPGIIAVNPIVIPDLPRQKHAIVPGKTAVVPEELSIHANSHRAYTENTFIVWIAIALTVIAFELFCNSLHSVPQDALMDAVLRIHTAYCIKKVGVSFFTTLKEV